jgi:ABC-type multidrug transport system ATPase subunit
MAVTLQFSEVNCGRMKPLSFALEERGIRVVRLAGREEKATVIDLAVGERAPVTGRITLDGRALDAAPPGSTGWVPENGGLISNLKAWENVTLPLWYHRGRRVGVTERAISEWLPRLGVSAEGMAAFMASPAAALSVLERKRAGLLRGLLLAPRLLVVDAGLFSGLTQGMRENWAGALEMLAGGEAATSILVVAAEGDPSLPWETITTG